MQSVRDAILSRLRKRDQIMWDRISADVANVPAPAGYGHTAGNRADYGKLGYKHDLFGVDAWTATSRQDHRLD